MVYNNEYYEMINKARRDTLTEEERQKEDNEIKLANIGVQKSIYQKLDMIRNKRDELLSKNDFYFMVPDINLSVEDRDKIIKYRQELRDFPNKIVNGIYDNHIHILAITLEEILDYLPKL